MKELNFLCQKLILVKLKQKVTFASVFFVMKINSPFQPTFQITYFEDSMDVMMINHIMFHVSQNKK